MLRFTNGTTDYPWVACAGAGDILAIFNVKKVKVCLLLFLHFSSLQDVVIVAEALQLLVLCLQLRTQLMGEKMLFIFRA